ncbi:MAG: flavin oxidoreductase [Bacteroidetes bacterium]|nr:MAG: flavin oxidoreductase [Bacteroidota bacterium]
MKKRIVRQEINAMEKRRRVQFANSLPGLKSAQLIGTINQHAQTNLAIFSSFLHVGSSPPLYGFITRPTTVARHTYQNIRSTSFYTVNHIHHTLYRQAHQTSARYEAHISEFDACGFTPEFKAGFPAPFVAESHIQLGLKYVEEHPIAANGTILLVGELLELWVPPGYLGEDGYVDAEAAGSVGVSGLDSYHLTNRLERLPYAKPGKGKP